MKEQAASLGDLQNKFTTLTESHKTSLETNQQLQEAIHEATAKAAAANASASELRDTEAEVNQRLGALQAELRSEHEKSLVSTRTALENEKQRAVLEKELGDAKENVKRLMTKLDTSETEHSAAAQRAKVRQYPFHNPACASVGFYL